MLLIIHDQCWSLHHIMNPMQSVGHDEQSSGTNPPVNLQLFLPWWWQQSSRYLGGLCWVQPRCSSWAHPELGLSRAPTMLLLLSQSAKAAVPHPPSPPPLKHCPLDAPASVGPWLGLARLVRGSTDRFSRSATPRAPGSLMSPCCSDQQEGTVQPHQLECYKKDLFMPTNCTSSTDAFFQRGWHIMKCIMACAIVHHIYETAQGRCKSEFFQNLTSPPCKPVKIVVGWRTGPEQSWERCDLAPPILHPPHCPPQEQETREEAINSHHFTGFGAKNMRD